MDDSMASTVWTRVVGFARSTAKGEGGGVVLTGGGTYTVDAIESGQGPLMLTAKPSGCVDGPSIHNCRQTVEVVTLTPTD
jgi:hypothetical protein